MKLGANCNLNWMLAYQTHYCIRQISWQFSIFGNLCLQGFILRYKMIYHCKSKKWEKLVEKIVLVLWWYSVHKLLARRYCSYNCTLVIFCSQDIGHKILLVQLYFGDILPTRDFPSWDSIPRKSFTPRQTFWSPPSSHKAFL